MKKCMKKIYSALLCAILIFTGCGSSFQKDMSYTAFLPQDIKSLDPQTANTYSERLVIRTIFEGLCRLDDTGKAVPGIAEKWKANSDKTKFTFYLDPDALWSNGTPVTAQDFVFGVRRAVMPGTSIKELDSELLILQNAEAVHSEELPIDELGVIALDDHSIEFSLVSSFEEFPRLTASPRYMPCSEEAFIKSEAKYGISAKETLTNGSYTFKSNYAWSPEIKLSLTRTNSYNGSAVRNPLDITFLLSEKENKAIAEDKVAALLKAEIDILSVDEKTARELESQDATIFAVDDMVTGLLLNSQVKDSNPFLSSIGMREVFMKTINREAMITRIEKPYEAANSIFPNTVQFGGDVFAKNRETPLILEDTSVTGNIPSLISQIEDLTEMPYITVICPDDEMSVNLVTGLIVSWNEKLSNSHNMEALPQSEFDYRVATGDYEAALYTLKTNSSMPTSMLEAFETTASPQLLDNTDFDATLHTSNYQKDTFDELENKIAASYIFYPIYYGKSYYALSPHSRNIKVNPDNIMDFSNAVKKKP